jgi:short-subunit dehydrogenase
MRIDQNTVAVVTGAASGIGRALAVNLASRGASLALADVNAVGLEETKTLVSNSNTKVTTHSVDVSNQARIEAFASEVLESHGRVNLLVNNAGVALGGTFDQVSLEDMQWLVGINFWGVVHGCKTFLPILRREPVAHVVNLSSVFGLFAPPGQTAYAAAKFAVRGFSESLRHELEGGNVRLSVVHPGGIKTNIARNSRVGANVQQSPEEIEREARDFERAFITTAEAAAERIARGIERDEPRILVGPDARQVDWIQRLFPTTYWRIIKNAMKS